MFHDFLSLLFPETCRLCNESLSRRENLICTSCLFKLPRIDLETDTHVLLSLFHEARIYSGFYSLLKFKKKGIAQDFLHQIKYGNQPELAELAGRMLGLSMREKGKGQDIDLIIPIPLHKKKKLKRGYNQSDYFGKGLSETLDLSCETSAVFRKTNNATQTKKSRLERLDNVADVFNVNYPEKIRNKHVLLVDDVITTGATLYVCSNQILLAGARHVSIASIAVAK